LDITVFNHDEMNEKSVGAKVNDKISNSNFEFKTNVFIVLLINLKAANSLIKVDFFP